MNLLNKPKTAAIATALVFCGANATAEANFADYPRHAVNWVSNTAGSTWETVFGSEQRTSTRQALKDVRHAREDGRSITNSDLPALISIMGEPMPHADAVSEVIRPRTPTSRLYVKFITEPNVDVAMTDANALTDELFQGDASAKLLLIKANTFKLADNSVYDVPMRARVAYLDMLVRERLKSSRQRTLITGDTIILGVATGVALASGLRRGPTQAAEYIRDINYRGLAKEARVAATTNADKAVTAGRTALDESVSSTRSFGRRLASVPGKFRRGAVTYFASPRSKIRVQQDVNSLFEALAAHQPAVATAEARGLLKLREVPVPRDGLAQFGRTSVDGLEVSLETSKFTSASDAAQSRLVFRKSSPKDHAAHPPKHFVSKYMDPVDAENLYKGLTGVTEVAPRPVFGVTGVAREASEELTEATTTLQSNESLGAAIESKASDLGETIADTTKQAKAEVAQVATEAKDTVTTLAQEVKEDAAAAGERLSSKAADVKDEVVATAENAKDSVAATTDKVTEGTEATQTAAKPKTPAKPRAAKPKATVDDSSAKQVADATLKKRSPRKKAPPKANESGLNGDAKISSGPVDPVTGEPPVADKVGAAVETAGQSVGEATEKAGEVVADGTEKAGHAIRNFGSTANEKITQAASKTGDALKGVVSKTGDAVKGAGAKASAVAKGARESGAKAAGDIKVQTDKVRASLRSRFENFDRTAAYRDGFLVGGGLGLGWNVGHAYGLVDGQDHAAFGLEDQISSELLQPVPLEDAKQNVSQ